MTRPRPERASASAAIDAALLEMLLRQREPITVQTLALRCQRPIDEVMRQLQRLRDAGCRLDQHPQHGVSLVQTGLGVWVDYLQARCRRFGGGSALRPVEVYRRTGSTQDAARRMIDALGVGADGGVVLADEQARGRGRLGRPWIAPAGSAVLMSLACVGASADGSDLGVEYLTFAAAVAVAEAIEAVMPPGSCVAAIKWPNDVLVDGRKIAGILVEAGRTAHRASAVVGVGVNVSPVSAKLPAPLRSRVTCLRDCGAMADRLHVAAELIQCFDAARRQRSSDDLLAQWRRRCAMWGQRLHLRSAGRDLVGTVVDLDPHDGLILRTDRGSLIHVPAATATVHP